MHRSFRSAGRHLAAVGLALVAMSVATEKVFGPPTPEHVIVAQISHDPLPPVTCPVPLDPTQVPKKVPPIHVDDETLWLARLMYSETKRPEEQVLVGWVARNRAQTNWRGQGTLEEVVRDPYQFSAVWRGEDTWNSFTALDQHTSSDTFPYYPHADRWHRTLALAYCLRKAEESERPFPLETRHFYSERSLAAPRSIPEWTIGKKPVKFFFGFVPDSTRFRFYAYVP